MKCIWKWDDEERKSLTMTQEPIETDDFPLNPTKLVRAFAYTMMKVEWCRPIGNIPQSRVTWTTAVNLGGAIPRSGIKTRAVKFLMYLDKIRRTFDQSTAIDDEINTQILAKMKKKKSNEGYSDEENAIVAKGYVRAKPSRLRQKRGLGAKPPRLRQKRVTGGGLHEALHVALCCTPPPPLTLTTVFALASLALRSQVQLLRQLRKRGERDGPEEHAERGKRNPPEEGRAAGVGAKPDANQDGAREGRRVPDEFHGEELEQAVSSTLTHI